MTIFSRKAAGHKFTFNLVTPDNGESFVVELSNATLTNIRGEQAANADLTITVNRADLELVMGGRATFEELEAAGKARLEGDRAPFDLLRSMLEVFTPDFEIMPGTRGQQTSTVGPRDPFEAPATGDTSGG